MRSGTHLLIDLLLNNFRVYRRAPLYLDLDGYLLDGRPVGPLLNCGAWVAKTHHPHRPVPAVHLETLRRFAERAIVLRPERDLAAVGRSLASFGEAEPRVHLEQVQVEAAAFWDGFDSLRIPFAELTRPAATPRLVERIAAFAGLPAPDVVVETLPKAAVSRVLRAKLLTRLLGHRAPRINTTIQFDSTRR